jgi:hypothetical protein
MQMRKNCTFSNILQKVKSDFFANIYHSPCDSYWNSKKSITLKPPNVRTLYCTALLHTYLNGINTKLYVLRENQNFGKRQNNCEQKYFCSLRHRKFRKNNEVANFRSVKYCKIFAFPVIDMWSPSDGARDLNIDAQPQLEEGLNALDMAWNSINLLILKLWLLIKKKLLFNRSLFAWLSSAWITTPTPVFSFLASVPL